MKSIKILDLVILIIFVIAMTFQPFFLHRELNLFELGIYAPGIDAILHGAIPYRDFFYLRGPVELYVPAFLMTIFGKEMAVLYSYFYFGTVLTLIFCVLIAREILKERLFLFLCLFVLVGRTFPRVVFTYWGGLRFALGLLAVLFMIQYFKDQKKRYLIFAGATTALAFLTSPEVGLYSFLAVFFGNSLFDFYQKRGLDHWFYRTGILCFGLGCIFIPFVLYLFCQQAFFPFLESFQSVSSNMLKIFPQFDPTPRNFLGYFSTMFNPMDKNFRHITLTYLYFALGGYFVFLWRNRKLQNSDFAVMTLFIYGVGMYISAFRNVWASQFEMALQPEKLLYFFLLERVYSFLVENKGKILPILKIKNTQVLVNGFLVVVVMSSLGYGIARYSSRDFGQRYLLGFLTGKKIEQMSPLAKESPQALNIPGLRGLVVPSWQAEEFLSLRKFFDEHTSVDEKIFVFPELAIYHFILDRPFVGRFPMTTFSWLNDPWHEELMMSLRNKPSQYVIVPKKLTPNFEHIYFRVESNRRKYDQVRDFIDKNYQSVYTTKDLIVLVRKDKV